MLPANELNHHQEFYHGFLKVLGRFLMIVSVVVVFVFAMMA